MAVVIDASVGGVAANSYETQAEADLYFAARIPLDPPWEDAEDPTASLAMATRTLNAGFSGGRVLVPASNGQSAYYIVRRKWNGTPSTTTQRLAWPRIGLYHDNGAAVAADEIPWELKDAESELAGQLNLADRTLDSDVAVQGITSVQAGSVSVSFRDGYIDMRLLPQAVIDLIPPSWYTEEQIDSVGGFMFEVI